MKIFLNTIMLFFLSLPLVKATPAITSFGIHSDHLQNGKIKVYEGGSTEFVAILSGNRGMSGSTYENVIMEVVFYTVLSNVEYTLKTMIFIGDNFNGAFLRYNGPYGENRILISIPESLKDGLVRVKYRYKDANNIWQPTDQYGYNVLSTSYQTINVSPYPHKVFNPYVLSKVNTIGFVTTGVLEYSNYYLVEDDIMLSKSYVNNYSSTSSIVNIANHNINIVIDQSIWANNLWYGAMRSAAVAWNSQTYSNIKINLIRKTIGNNNIAMPNTIDIEVKQSTDPVKVPVMSRFIVNDGKPGNEILFNPNFTYPGTGLAVSESQATWNLVQAIGHCLGIKHAAGTDSGNSAMLRTASSSYNNHLSSTHDSQEIGSRFPINTSSQVVPFIAGLNSLHPGESAYFYISYFESDITYSWLATGINGTVYNEVYPSWSLLSEVDFPAGNYQLRCTISGGKYSTPVTATKNIVVQ